MTGKEKFLAQRLFDVGAIQFGAFRLKLHEKNPDAPLSPIYRQNTMNAHQDSKILAFIGYSWCIIWM